MTYWRFELVVGGGGGGMKIWCDVVETSAGGERW